MTTKYKTLSLCLLACMTSISALAHDAWIETDIGQAKAPQSANLSFYIGHAGEADKYLIGADKLSSFYSLGPNGLTNHLSVTDSQTPTASLNMSFPDTGTHVVSLSTFRTYIELPADKFNDYATEEGITPILRARAAKGTFNDAGKELYSRHLKTIVNSNASGCLDRRAAQPVGQPLEIIPIAAKGGEDSQKLQVEVQYRGKATAGVTLHMNDIIAGEATQLLQTDKDGQAWLTLPKNHDWYVHAAWSEAVQTDDNDADFLTVLASLSLAQHPSNPKICFK